MKSNYNENTVLQKKNVYLSVNMNIGIVVAGLIITALCTLLVITNQEQSGKCEADVLTPSKDLYKEAMTEISQERTSITTRNLLIQTLKQLGGSILGISEKDGRINYAYQGHQFYFDSTDECSYINIWDPYWYDIPLDDIDQLALMRKVINLANLNEICQLFYTIGKDENQAYVHSRRNILFVPQILDIDKYLHSELTMMFNIERHFVTELERIDKMEKAIRFYATNKMLIYEQ